MATPFILLGDLDRRLRSIISANFTAAEVAELCNTSGRTTIESINDLSMGDYQRMLERPEIFDKLGWGLDRAIIIRRLDELRNIRNDVMHFNPDPLPHDTVDKLRNMLAMLRDYAAV